MMATPVEPAQLRGKAAAAYRNRRRGWIIDPAAAAGDTLTVALHPPTEKQVAADPDTVVAWLRGWQRAELGAAARVEWAERHWRSYGTQQVPMRVIVRGADEIAHLAGHGAAWRRICARRARLTELAGPSTGAAAPDTDLPTRLAATATRWSELTETDFEILLAALRWLRDHPGSGVYIRQLPIPGVDTKWVGGHRRLLEELLTGIRGDADLGVRTVPRSCAVALCDPTLLPELPRIFSAPLEALATLPIAPPRVLILENKEGLYALPALPGVVAVHGSGYAAHELAAVPWIAESDCVYWGDLDTHGFAILDWLRSHLPQVRSVLMDLGTATDWAELAVAEPRQSSADQLPRLTANEQPAFDFVRDRHLRLEQERIPWPVVLTALEAAGLASPAAPE